MTEREIPRNPKTPELNDEVIALLTDLCFRKDDPPQEADMLFIFSSPIYTKKVAALAKDMLIGGLIQKVFVTGGVPEYKDSRTIVKPEAELLLELLSPQNFPSVQFFTENRSHNTLENVTEAMRVYDFRDVKKLWFIFKSHAAGRGYLTLRRFLPDAVLLQRTLDFQYEGVDLPLTRENWHTFPFGRERVWGEYLRIREYGQRGDIAFDEVRDKAQAIARMYGSSFS